MRPGDTRSLEKRRAPLLAGTAIVLAAVALTAAYSRRADGIGVQDAGGVPAAATTQAEQRAGSRAMTPAATAADRPRTVVSFLLDRRVTSGLYLGDRWVSPEVFHFAQPGTEYEVRAKLQAVDAQDRYVDLNGDWSTDDPAMIAIARDEDGAVTVRVRQPGAARLFVAAGGERKTLSVEARRTADAMDVAIRQ